MAVPTCPNSAAMSRITRGGRPVTSTNWAPAASTRAKAATVRSEIVPSPRMIVPSRSVATSSGRAGAWRAGAPRNAGLIITCKSSPDAPRTLLPGQRLSSGHELSGRPGDGNCTLIRRPHARWPSPGGGTGSADAARPELDADSRPDRPGRFGHAVLPGPLAAAAHDDEVAVPEAV